MSGKYVPLYRKYRPDTFGDLVGQEVIEKTLSNAIETDRVAHAYLFSGPRGTGKTSTARIFAKALNCKEGPTVTPCGKCSNCLDMANGFSIDVIEIDAASNRKVEDARNLLEKVQYVPANGKFKIYIIDEVHMLTNEAFNTLLKTLEEPPASLIFILATTEPHKILETIISRCQRFDFRRITSEDIFTRLKKIAEIEKIDITDDALKLISRKSSGGLRDAIALLDQSSVLMIEGKKITDKDVHSLIGSISEEEIYKIVDIIANKQVQNILEILNAMLQSGNEPLQIIRELMTYFRNLLIAKTCSNIKDVHKLTELSEDYSKALKSQAESFESVEIVQIIEKLAENEKNIRNSINQYLWLEVALIGICHREDINTIKELEKRISLLEQNFSGNNIQAVIPKQVASTVVKLPELKKEEKQIVQQEQEKTQILPKAPEVEPPPVASAVIEKPVAPEPQNIQSASSAPSAGAVTWQMILDKIDNIPARSLLQDQANPIEISSEKILIAFKNDTFIKAYQEGGSKRPFLEKAVQAFFITKPQILIRTQLPQDAEKKK